MTGPIALGRPSSRRAVDIAGVQRVHRQHRSWQGSALQSDRGGRWAPLKTLAAFNLQQKRPIRHPLEPHTSGGIAVDLGGRVNLPMAYGRRVTDFSDNDRREWHHRCPETAVNELHCVDMIRRLGRSSPCPINTGIQKSDHDKKTCGASGSRHCIPLTTSCEPPGAPSAAAPPPAGGLLSSPLPVSLVKTSFTSATR